MCIWVDTRHMWHDVFLLKVWSGNGLVWNEIYSQPQPRICPGHWVSTAEWRGDPITLEFKKDIWGHLWERKLQLPCTGGVHEIC